MRPSPLDVVNFVKRVRRGGGTPPELIPEYASANNAIIFYKESTVEKYVHKAEETCPIYGWHGMEGKNICDHIYCIIF